MSLIIDASVIIAVILGERGAEVAAPMLQGSSISTVNFSEILRKLVDQGSPFSLAYGELTRFEMRLADFTVEDAATAAALRPLTKHLGLSFADRACLALAQRLNRPILTADREWAKLDLGLDIRQIRD